MAGMASESSATGTTIAITGRSEGPKRTTVETADTLAEWMATVEERCPVADNLNAGTDVHVEVERA
jgi:uncharacterized OsmC-like protein